VHANVELRLILQLDPGEPVRLPRTEWSSNESSIRGAGASKRETNLQREAELWPQNGPRHVPETDGDVGHARAT
jgi:hypothetical protein